MRMSEFLHNPGPEYFNKRARYKGYLPKRVDKNQPALVRTLRQLGFSVKLLHESGKGVFDTMLSKHGLNILAEIKNGEKPPSARKFTGPQKIFNFTWQGMRCVLTNDDDCFHLNEQVKRILDQCRLHNILFEVTGSEEEQYKPSLS